MVFKVREVSFSIDRLLEQGDIENGEVGLSSASLSKLGESLIGAMALGSKRAAICAEPPASSILSPLSMSSLLSTSPSKTAATSPSFPSNARPRPIPPVLLKKHNPYITDKGHLIQWLDAMKAQSPPQFHSTDGNIFDFYDAEATEHAAWMERHPSALDMFEKVMRAAKGKQVAVFLDYDGTLSPIVDDPDRAYMSDDMRATVKEVATYFPTAIISGRGRQKVYDFVQLAELFYAGSHGMDIMGPATGSNGFKANGTRAKDHKGNEVVFFQPASEYLPLIDKVCTILIESTKEIEGAKVEHNKYCATIHFRRVKEESWGRLAEKVESVLKGYPTLSLTHGRKVLEIRPAIAWDKGKAVNFLLTSLGLANSSDVLPVYIGDDRTDEDAFKLLKGMKHGCSILVTTVAKETKANFSLRDPSEVMKFLHRLVRWKKRGLEGHHGSSSPGGHTATPTHLNLKFKRTPPSPPLCLSGSKRWL